MNNLGRNDRCRCGSGKKYKKCCLPIDENAYRNNYESVCVLVGNGLNYDFISEFDIKSINSSYPLSQFDSEDISYKNFIDKVPDIRKHLLSERHKNDFKAINRYIKRFGDDVKKDCQLRRFLAIAYSLLQLKYEELQNDLWPWKWTKWLYANKHKLCAAISFNYDLLLENIFSTINLEYYRPGAVNEGLGIPIIKPHGSIDFDIADGLIGGANDLWTVSTKLNDVNGKVKVISKSKWLKPRLQADIIPPSQRNYQLKLGWVETGYNILKRKVKDLDAFLVVGFSYGEADKDEFKRILKMLPKNKEIDFYIINPDELVELNELLVSKGYNAEKIKCGLPW